MYIYVILRAASEPPRRADTVVLLEHPHGPSGTCERRPFAVLVAVGRLRLRAEHSDLCPSVLSIVNVM